ncbi:inositol monophosphatase [Halobacteriales archaeon QS_3_64_16]|nr:MAG: inositol monophosphatase [Halobacteriales archaeon QS_3_64_16]
MHRRRLVTTEEIVAIASPDSEGVLERLAEWCDEQGIECKSVAVGEDIESVYEHGRDTLGVTLGGDGTFLEGVRAFAPREIPLLGINTGTLAFLPRVQPADMEDALAEVLRGQAEVKTRQQLQARAEGLDAVGINDVMIQHIPPENPVDRKITRLKVFVDGDYVGEYDGTGLAIATPTGSTGISLSANGPIHSPDDNTTLELVPLHTHSMGVRPLVVGASSDIRVVSENEASLLVDGGRSHTTLEPGEAVAITGAQTPMHIARTSLDDTFYTALAAKLGWGIREGKVEGTPQTPAVPGEESAFEDVVGRAADIASEAVRAAGEPLQEIHGRVESVEYKGDKSDVVSEADYKSEQIIAAVIENEFPEHAIRSEEDVSREGSSAYTWLLDPLDGTGNYVNGNPNYSISVGLLDDGEPVMGTVYAPEFDDLFEAIAGGKAYLNGQVVGTTDRDELAESMLVSGYDPDGTFLTHCYQATRGIRRFGSAALHLCYLASGSADAVWEYDTYPWDIAAGIVIARAAGARITDVEGTPYRFDEANDDDRKELLATNGPLHDALLEHVSSRPELQQAEADD